MLKLNELSIEEQRAVTALVSFIDKLRKKEFPEASLGQVIELYTRCLNEVVFEESIQRKNKRKQA